ncbi:helix-turn-helix transcriptional regulator [Shewanella sp. 10N.286.51.B8]|uniref:helix-turn-helix transcriptional regulator n=1 Tax=Shewanella sp. 10N.286.51.B8 TaxID=3229708 RepID=UPI00354DFF08
MSSVQRWEVLLRYRLIETFVQWEGRLTTNHLCSAFGIGRQQASKDIQNYLKIAPNNLIYNPSKRGYEPSKSFSPQFTQGLASEYLNLIHNNQTINGLLTTIPLPKCFTEVLTVPERKIKSDVLRPLIKASREGMRIEVRYFSMNSPKGEQRIIAPHTLVFCGLRWHVRAYCEKHRDYRDFVLNRISEVEDGLGERLENPSEDADWHQKSQLIITPNPNYSTDQQKLIARDYLMENNKLIICCRKAVVGYVMDRLGVKPAGDIGMSHLVLSVL